MTSRSWKQPVRAPAAGRCGADVVLDLGWGRLVFGQTFADLRGHRRRAAGRGVRPSATSASTRATRTCWSASRPTSCSSTRATPTAWTCTGTARARSSIRGVFVRTVTSEVEMERDQRHLRAVSGMVTGDAEVMWAQPPHPDVHLPGGRGPPHREDRRHGDRGRPRAAPSATRRPAPACGASPSTRRTPRRARARRWSGCSPSATSAAAGPTWTCR